jgi:hypothetical protein
MTKPDKSAIVIHKLKGKCRYKRKGNWKVCSVCGHKKELPMNLNTFSTGDVLRAETMNDNFNKIERRMNKLGDYLSDIEKKLDVVQNLIRNGK